MPALRRFAHPELWRRAWITALSLRWLRPHFPMPTGTPLARKKECWASFANSLQQSTPVLIARYRHGDQFDALLPNRTAEALASR